ncbi:MAG: hypothetical protein KGZ58_07425 [Ignavibacteriales bacterium]|nr:hypothetical protein [Ignavibacteriales bacterium]
MNKATQTITNNTTEYLKFLKSKFKIYHLSNIFFRDMHYGTMEYLTKRGIKITYLDAETVTQEVTTHLETNGVLKRLDKQTFLLNYPEFWLPRKEVAPPAPKPVAATPTTTAPVTTPAQAS